MAEGIKPAYCAQCGVVLPADARFCTVCGTAVAAPQPAEAVPPSAHPQHPHDQQAIEAQLEATSKPRRGLRYALIAGVWAVLAVIVAVAGAAYGYLTAPETPAALDLPSTEQVEAHNGYGEPDAWVVAEGPTEPGAESARVEEWFFYDAGKIIVFVNGSATDAIDYTPYDEVAPTNRYSPLDFGSELQMSDVEDMLGESGDIVPLTESAFSEYQAYAYTEARLLIGYLDGRFYTAQTF